VSAVSDSEEIGVSECRVSRDVGFSTALLERCDILITVALEIECPLASTADSVDGWELRLQLRRQDPVALQGPVDAQPLFEYQRGEYARCMQQGNSIGY